MGCVEGAGDDVKNGCGLHIHEGMICDDADEIGGHYYNQDMDTDPWLTVDYVAKEKGGEVKTKGETKVNIGTPLKTATARAVIVHQLADGARIACAQLTRLSTSCKKGSDENVQCPGGPECAGNQCCPGTDESGNRTFPCPSATDLKEANCETSFQVELCVGK